MPAAERPTAPRRAPRRRRRLPLGCVILLWVALAVGLTGAWGALALTGHDPRLLWYQYQQVDAVHVARERADASLIARGLSDGFGGAMIPLDQTISDAHVAQSLYTAAFDQPAQSLFERYSCALGPPITYHMAFSRAGHAVADVEVLLNGCVYLSLAGIATRLPTHQFMQLLADTLHISMAELFDPIVAPAPSIPQITVRVERLGETPAAHVIPLYRFIANPAIGFGLDNALAEDASYNGSPNPPPASACPPNAGVDYRFTFYQDGAEFAFKQVQATGCQLVYTFDGFPPEHISNPQFWQTLAQALGVPEASLGVGPSPAYWTAPPTVPATR